MVTSHDSRLNLKSLGHCQLGVNSALLRLEVVALARSARTRRRIPFDERPLSEHAVVPRPE